MKIVAAYVVVASLWIFLSDRALETAGADNGWLGRLHTLKGWLFVIVTAALLYFLLKRTFLRIQAAARGKAHAERQLGTLIRNLPGFVYRCRNDRNRTMEFLSDGISELAGYPRESILGKAEVSYGDLIHPEDRESVQCLIEEAIRQNRPFRVEYRIRTSSGAEKWVWEQGRRVDTEHGWVLEGYATDITDRKVSEERLRKMHERLMHSQKMEAVGRMAAGIAHDLNNVVSAILGFCTLLQNRLDPDDTGQEDLKEIQQAGERAASLASQLKTIGREQKSAPRELDLNALVRGLGRILEQLVDRRVRIQYELGENLPMVLADPIQVEQILLNLCLNAGEAMPQGGTLTIRTGPVEGEPNVALVVSDTGTGIPEEKLRRIFEPFFTTKEKGTGLGLSMVHAIVEQMGGWINVESEEGRGTTFRVALPAVEQAAIEAVSSGEKEGVSGSETVLVIDPDGHMRGLARAMLTGLGYRVLSEANPSRAARLARAEQRPIHVVLADAFVLAMVGRDNLMEELREGHPDIRLVVISAFPRPAVSASGLIKPEDTFVSKPFGPWVLARKIRQALRGVGSS